MVADASEVYRRRDPPRAVLHRVLTAHLPAFLQRVGPEGLPAHVEKELRAYLDCGIFERGAACFFCDGCGSRVWVALSCKRRGLYHRRGEGASLEFLRLPAPEPQELHRLTELVAVRVLRLLRRKGLLGEEAGEEGDLFGLLQGASVLNRAATGPGGVRKVPGRLPAASPGQVCAEVQGFNLHAGVSVIAGRRERLRALCRYVLRPPLSEERLELLPTGDVRIRLKRPWSDGTVAIELSSLEFVGRVCALIPPPAVHLIHYHGVLAPNASWREEIVPVPAPAAEPGCPDELTTHAEREAKKQKANRTRQPRRTPWAELLKKTFSVDVLQCSCGTRLRFLCFVFDPRALRAIGKSLGLRASAATAARASPQLELAW